MPSKNDLSAFKLNSESILNENNTAQEKTKSNAGRKPLPAHEKRSETLVIKLTPSEMNTIDGKRGLADRAVYVRHIMGQTSLFQK